MKRILVVDDEAQIRTMLTQMLEQEGYEVLTAENGEEGLTLVQKQAFDLVITDMIMPVKDGGEAIAELIRNDPDVRIIAMSGGGRGNISSILSLASELGARRTLAKPFTLTEFMSAVNDTLESEAPDPSKN